jgi:hypothetical protein
MAGERGIPVDGDEVTGALQEVISRARRMPLAELDKAELD